MWKLSFSGVGGQGVVTAAILLAEAAVIHENRHAVQTQSYGAQARGGLTRADVTISDSEIHYPKVEQAHVLVCLHQDAYNASAQLIRPGGILIVDADAVTVSRTVDARTHGLALSSTAAEAAAPRALNMATLGALVGLTDIVQADSLRAAVRSRFRAAGHPAAGTRDSMDPAAANLRAFDAGLHLARSEAALA
jgi:2-oxoglutarate ferredoxin oxidoreductase subunit gamma